MTHYADCEGMSVYRISKGPDVAGLVQLCRRFRVRCRRTTS